MEKNLVSSLSTEKYTVTTDTFTYSVDLTRESDKIKKVSSQIKKVEDGKEVFYGTCYSENDLRTFSMKSSLPVEDQQKIVTDFDAIIAGFE